MQRCHSWRYALVCATMLWALSSAAARAQTTVAVTASPPTTTTVVAPVAPPAAGFFGGLGGCCAGCKAKLAGSPLCVLIKNALKPLNAATGGLICGSAAGPGGPGGPGAPPPAPACDAAAKIKADEAQAAARRDAVRFLGTVDCHWYPEAEAALIASLRCDRSECVRMEAALALGRGCCCTKSTVEALRIAASGSSRDGNPGERCARVRFAALNALESCLCSCGDSLPATPVGNRPENPPEALAPGEPSLDVGTTPRLQSYYVRLAERPASDVLRDARSTLAAFEQQQLARSAGETTTENQSESIARQWRGPRATPAAPAPATTPTTPPAAIVASQGRFVPMPPSTLRPPTEIVAPSRPAEVRLQRLPAPLEASPEPIYLGRLPSDEAFR